jgi:hypothetical protein
VQKAWRGVYDKIQDNATARELPADRLRYRDDVEYKGFNETGSSYDLRVACYGVDETGKPRVVVADIYEDGVHIQQVFSEAVRLEEGFRVSLTTSKVDRSYARFSLLEVGIYAGRLIDDCALDDSSSAEPIMETDATSQDTVIFPVPVPKASDLPN